MSSPANARTRSRDSSSEQGRVRVRELAARFGGLHGHHPQGPRRPGARAAAHAHPRRRAAPGPRPPRARLRPPRAAAAGREGAHRRGGRGRSSTTATSIVMDASTTGLAVARRIRAQGGWSQLTVITNGLRIASELAGSPGITVLMTGGRVRQEAMSVVGHLGRRPVRADQRPDRVRRRGRVRPGVRPLRRHRGRGPDQALDGRRGPARSSRSSTTRSGSGSHSRRSAAPTRSTRS